MKKALCIVTVLAVAGLLLSSCQNKKQATESVVGSAGNTAAVTNIVVGTGNKYEPYCYADSSGNLIGYDYQVLVEVDRRLPQYSFSYETFDFANILLSLGAGKIDIAAHEYEENPDRRATYLYGDERYSDYDSWLMVHADGPWATINSLDEIAGNPNAIVGVNLGSNMEAFIKTYNQTHTAQIAYQTYVIEAPTLLLENLKSGRWSAALLMLVMAERYNKIGNGLRLIPRGETPAIESGAYFIFAKNNPALKEAVDGALRDMKADGTLARIYKEAVLDYFANL
ncbi:MAG: transporter substrate-binding domain-containing protein [Treponema sp.]|jgi:L-cystine transport system substrate-binding protein|nr:transporter substrate-binding domain-containing protein [Treponema sp.]